MRQKVQFLSCVFVALLLLSVRVNAQKPSCFSGTLPSHRVMAGDTLVYDLDIITKMDNPILTVDSSAGDLAGYTFELPYTFFPNGVNEDLEQDVRKCDAVAQGLTDSDFVFLCDSNKVFFLSIENHSGSVIRPETKLINLIQKPEDSELVCDTIRNDSQNNVYLACRKPGLTSNIFIYTISLKEKVVTDPFVIEQPADKPEQVISGPLKLSVDSYDTQTHVHLKSPVLVC